jgi:hypothetical protein
MVEHDELKDFMGTMKWSSDFLYNVLIKREAERKLLLFYSLGMLSEQYIQMSEDALKKGDDYAAPYYANKAEEIRQACRDIFGSTPEKEYYHPMPYKVPRWYNGSVNPSEVAKFSEFCVANIAPDEEVLKDEKLLYAALRDEFKSHRRTGHDISGVEATYTAVLRERFKMLANKPPKLDGVYEMMLLLDVVDEILEVLKHPELAKKEMEE